jgi:hypothetical protein
MEKTLSPQAVAALEKPTSIYLLGITVRSPSAITSLSFVFFSFITRM